MAIVRLRPADLEQALATGALSVHYQPQVEIKTGTLAGVEAFVRWPHAVHGMIGPSDIRPARRPGRPSRRVRSMGDRRDLPSGEQLAGGGRPRAGRCCERLERDASATGRAQAHRRARGQRCRPQDHRARMSARIDRASGADQGAGRDPGPRRAAGNGGVRDGRTPALDSELRHVQDPVPDLTRLRRDAGAIVAAVAEARRIGARVVADSVESAGREEALASLGVEIVQGYLYGPEVAPAELRTLMKRPGAFPA